ncbi:NAD-dependent epimerase/dehydratase family protein [bacterium]|nr:NAD-dependent epimerase/dehydratase family protein [bacterium]
MNLDSKNILVTGGNGMIGRHLVELLYDTTTSNITIADLPNVDLRDRKDCKAVCEGQDIVFHLAGIKGSPQTAKNNPSRYFVPMLQFNTNMMEAAREEGVEWYLYTSSVGVYHPAEIFVEDDVWKTFPSENDWYPGWAKRMGELQAKAYEIEYGWKNYSIIRPANVYGSYDNFGEHSMVIPSLIKKAKGAGVSGTLSVWGDGSPIRDFVHAKDVARGMIFAVENEITEPLNLGSGNGVSIAQIASSIAARFKCGIEFDKTKPSGDSKRLMDMSRTYSYGFKNSITIDVGLEETIRWYLNE